LADASDIISNRAEAVRAAIETGAINDPRGLVTMSVQGIQTGLSTVRTLVSEILAITSSHVSRNCNPDYLQAVESRVKRQLASIEEVPPTVPTAAF